MRFRVTRYFGVISLCLALAISFGGCADDQQQQQEIQAQGDEAAAGDEELGNEAAAGGEEGAEQNQNNEGEQSPNQEGEEGQGQDQGAANNQGNEALEAEQPQDQQQVGEQAGNDLQEIIAEMNQDGQIDSNEVTSGQTPAANAAAVPAPTQVASTPSTPGVSAGPALPEMGSKMYYIVQAGDTLAGIAQKIYGSKERWKDIAELSGVKNPNMVFPGDVVYYQLDQETIRFATAYEAAPRSQIVVGQGDTLSSLAQKHLGSSLNWKAIWRHNDHINNPDKLAPGSTIYYVTPGALSAAIEYFKSFKIADLMNFTATVVDNNNHNQPEQNDDVQLQVQTNQNTDSDFYSNSDNLFDAFANFVNVNVINS